MKRRQAMLTGTLFATGALIGCDGMQSVLAPQGSVAERIAILAWVLFGICAVIFLVVLGASWMAVRGSHATRSRLARTGAVMIGGVAFPTMTLSGLLTYGVWLTQANPETEEGRPLRIEVVGEQWWWRINYVSVDGQRIASANEIRIPVGVPIELSLGSADVIHSFWVPQLAGKVDMIPGRTTKLRIIAKRTGVFRGQCAEYCGGPHALMALHVVAMRPPDYRQWLLAQSEAAAEPRTDEETRGRSLFLSAGCGACHSIRGTPAAGSIGPDLTHVGGRVSLAAATLPNGKAAFIRWIKDNQHIKPENLMPQFRNFTDAEIAAVATYLEGLK